ncbi:MAG: fibronectin/fibrinogen-binding protein [Clostridia bacterium]|nr:fibronectin/fibrinogen-binding protein [Clostridia bacterium]
MSLDGICIRALVDHLENEIIGGRVDRIHQPDKYTIILNIRLLKKNVRLLLSSHPQSGRFHITEKTRENPLHPPMFCMVLRKHLEGGKLISIKQMGFERVVHFTFATIDELGQRATRTLIGEFMGKHSNLILVNPENNIILDSIKRLNHSINQYREVLPGVTYITPPPQDKLALTEIKEEQFVENLLGISPNKSVARGLLSILSGVGPQTAQELSIRAGLDGDTKLEFLGQYDYSRLWQEIIWLKELIINRDYQPTLVQDENQKTIAFAPFVLEQYKQWQQKEFSNMSLLVEYSIGEMEDNNLLKQKVLDLDRIISKELERNAKKLAIQLDKIAQGRSSEQYRIWGELITANLYCLKQGTMASVSNFYSEEQEQIEIPLDPHLTPNENAQLYFKKYNKAKTAMTKASEQMEIIQREIYYLESIKSSLDRIENLHDLQEVRWELEDAGYVKAKPLKNNKSKNKEQKSNPLKINYGGWTIYIGKNNIQNDYVTFKIAKNADLWLHVKDIPGSHVVLKNPERKEIPDNILETAATLAAYFSKSRHSSQVPVDYTFKKNVKKIGGAKPGMVTYEQQKTIFVTPTEEFIQKIMKKQL